MSTSKKTEKAAGRVLLPPSVEPRKYYIKLEPDFEKYTFDGEVSIDIDVITETDTITVHSRDISVQQVSFTSKSSGVNPIVATMLAFNLKLQTLEITFPSSLDVGAGDLYIKYTGELNNQMAGFYRSGYTSAAGEKRIMASTQFESIDARRCFPCWDEPSRKAVFELTMVIPSNRQSLSNMPEAEFSLLPNGKTMVKYMPTPLMSTYLLAICVGEFDFLQGITKHGVTIRVFTPPNKKHLGEFALDVGLKTLDLYDDYFEIPYPLPKLDMIAIPEFAMGAMENWGLVTYREVDLLIDAKKASSAQRQRVCTVITHELAHQWFGNLVTMCWWDDLWLNEGFASWMQTYAADKLFPDWCMWEQFITDDQASALQLDSLRTSHPIQVPIHHAEEVEQVFDAISYSKGASVVHMLHAILGSEKFKEGLCLYMQRHKYSNTETFQLWQCWEQVSNKPIGSIMSSWTEQMGHPLLEVTAFRWDAAKSTVTLSLRQSWFLADGTSAASNEAKLWTLPLVYSSDVCERSEVAMMDTETFELTVMVSSERGWIKLNAGQNTLMRVAYTDELIESLIPAIRSKTLCPQDRIGLISDTYALAKAAKRPVEQLIKLLSAYADEDNSTVWEAVEVILVGLDHVLLDKPKIRAHFAAMAAKLIRTPATRVGWDPKPTDGHLGNLMRGTMVRLMGRFHLDSEEVRAESKRRFEAHCSNPEEGHLPSEYASSVYAIVLKTGSDAEFKSIMSFLSQLENTAERKLVYNALGAASTLELKRKVLDWAVSEVKLQDFFYPIMSVSSSGAEGRELCWTYFQENFDRITGMLERASASLTSAVITACCASFADAQRADEVERFFEEHPLPQNQRKISQILEKIRINGAFVDRIASSSLASAEFWAELDL